MMKYAEITDQWTVVSLVYRMYGNFFKNVK